MAWINKCRECIPVRFIRTSNCFSTVRGDIPNIVATSFEDFPLDNCFKIFILPFEIEKIFSFIFIILSKWIFEKSRLLFEILLLIIGGIKNVFLWNASFLVYSSRNCCLIFFKALDHHHGGGVWCKAWDTVD